MILAHYTLDNTKVYDILERFHTKFRRRKAFVRNPNPNPNPKPNRNFPPIKHIDVYKRTCIFSLNETKPMLVIKIQYSTNKEYYILNVLYDDYKDLL